MQELFWEIFLIAVFILFNGYLAGTEIAVVTARKSHIKQMAESGNKKARIFLRLKAEDTEFFSLQRKTFSRVFLNSQTCR